MLPYGEVGGLVRVRGEVDGMYPVVGRVGVGGRKARKSMRAMTQCIILNSGISFIFPNEIVYTTLT